MAGRGPVVKSVRKCQEEGEGDSMADASQGGRREQGQGCIRGHESGGQYRARVRGILRRGQGQRGAG